MPPFAADRTGGGMGDSRSLLCAASRFRSSCPPIRRRGRGGFSGAGPDFCSPPSVVREGNALEYLLAWMVPGSKLVPREEMLDPGENPDMYRRRQQEWMTLSQQNAILAAFRHAGRSAEEILLGVKVIRTLSGMPAEGKLMSGDRIVAVDGQPIQECFAAAPEAEGKAGRGSRFASPCGGRGEKLEKTLPLVPFSRAEGGTGGNRHCADD